MEIGSFTIRWFIIIFRVLTRVIFQFATDFVRRVSSFSPMISQWYSLLISVIFQWYIPSYPRDVPMIFPSYPHDIPRIFPLIIPSLTPNFTLPHPCGGCKRRSEKGSPGRSTLVDVSHWEMSFECGCAVESTPLNVYAEVDCTCCRNPSFSHGHRCNY